jgi:signal transduction histidine kinase
MPIQTPRLASGTGEMERFAAAEVRDGDLASVPYAVLVIGHHDRIEDSNRLADALVGYDHADLVGRRAVDVVSRLPADRASLPLEERVRFVSAAAGVCIHHRTGRDIPVDLLLCPHIDGSLIAILQPARIESTGRRASGVNGGQGTGGLVPRAQRSEDPGLREEDVAQIVHDLKSPLTTIALEAELLEHKLATGDHSDVKHSMTRITRNAWFLERMVQDLLDLCSLEAGQLELHPAPTELRTLLEDVIERVTTTRDRKRVFLRAEAPITLAIDDLRIERVIANFLQNAVKYAPDHTGIIVRLEHCGSCVCVSVIDAGPGLAPGDQERVFDKYTRTESARHREGTGLGLYVSKRIVEAHGGRIGVESVQGAGSRFFFELPV